MAAPSAQPPALPWPLLAWGALTVLLHVGLARFGYGVVLPSLRRELGLDYTVGGLLNAVHLAGYLAGTLVGPGLVPRFGLHRLARWAHALVAAGAGVCALVPVDGQFGAGVLAGGRMATGLGAGVAVMAVMVSVMGGVAEARRAAASVLMWTGMAGALLACSLGAPALLAPGAWRSVFLAAMAVALLLAVGFPKPAPTAGGGVVGGFTLAAVASARWAGLVATYGCFGLGYIAYATFAGTRLAAAQAPIELVARTWGLLGLATLAGSGATLWLLRQPAWRPHALPLAMGLAAAGCAVAAQAGAVAALAGAVGVGLGMAAIPALVTAAARTRSNAVDYARAFSVATAVMGLGQLLGPVLAGALADRFGSAAAPLFAAAAYGLGAVLATIDRRATG